MSFNLSTRINNLQNQVNNIANTGLTNPMEQVLNANNYAMNNLTVLNGGANVLQLQSSNIGGVTTNNNLTVGGDAFVHTLHYNALDPPISAGGNTYTLLGSNVAEPTAGNFTLSTTNPNSGFISNINNIQPYTSADFSFSGSSSSNSVVYGFTALNNKYPQNNMFNYIDYGVFWYPSNGIISTITNGIQGPDVIISTNTTINLNLKVLAGVIKVYVNGTENLSLEQVIPSNTYYLTAMAYMSGSLNINNVEFSANTTEGLSEVLAVSNDAGGQSMTNIDNINCSGVVASGNIYTDGYLEVGNAIDNSAQLHLFYGDGTSQGNNYQVITGVGDFMNIQQYKNNTLYNVPLQILDKTNITLQTNELIYTKNGTNKYYVLDSGVNPPMYKQIYYNFSGSSSNISTNIHPVFSVPLYTKSYDAGYGVNYAELLFSLTQITFSSGVTFPTGLTATLYLGAGAGDSYNGTLGNKIIIPISGSVPYVFNSTIPIILYYNNTTQFSAVYLLIKCSVGSISNYTCAFNNSNMVVSGYITSNQNGTITWT